MMHFFLLFVSNILINNFILVRFLGLCPFMGISRTIDSAIGMGLATTCVIVFVSIISWLINFYILIPFHLIHLCTMTYMLIIAVSVQIFEIIVKKVSSTLYRLLGIYLPLITTNCSVLAIPLMNTKLNSNFIESVLYGFSSSLGFFLVLVIFSSIRERISESDVPMYFRGYPIALITASLLAIAFMGFDGLIKF
ncbi:electron transport complex subunit RsxA [Buchnera aphidicola]|uniref:electron transport complex subunit RsxA n=1 Tax=Buchnera aphidicola TaxID=9 RepID=UPI0011D05E41|nr:electron transport complex subunit RsxA [Buchnera aphidicola]